MYKPIYLKSDVRTTELKRDYYMVLSQTYSILFLPSKPYLQYNLSYFSEFHHMAF